MEIQARIRLHRRTSTELTDSNPVLLEGQKVIESDTNYEKIGDGVTAWNSLPYQKIRTQDIDDNSTATAPTDSSLLWYLGNLKVTFLNLWDNYLKPKADLLYEPILNFTPENVDNKSIGIEADKASDVKYSSVKSIYDWATTTLWDNYLKPKADLLYGSLTGDNSWLGLQTFKKYKETVYTIPNISTPINPANGTLQYIALTGNWVVTGIENFENGHSIILHVNKSTYTIDLSGIITSNNYWVGKVAPTFGTTINVITIYKMNNTVYGSFNGELGI